MCEATEVRGRGPRWLRVEHLDAVGCGPARLETDAHPIALVEAERGEHGWRDIYIAGRCRDRRAPN
jgi:hypothetical protein